MTGGFHAVGVMHSRKTCDVESVYNAACEANDAITRKTDYYLSEFTFPDAFIQEVATTGRTAGYKGVCGGRWFWFDIDREDDLESAARDTARLVHYITSTFGITSENLHVFFSGAKGFHIGIPIEVFGESAMPSESFHSHCKAVAQRIGEEAGVTIDSSVYDRVRLLRSPNTRHSKTSLYKIPVRYDELIGTNAVERICQRAARPRRLLNVDNPNCVVGYDDVTYYPVTSYNSLAEYIWKEATTANSNRCAAYNASYSYGGVPRLRNATQDFLSGNVNPGERAVGLFKAAADCYRNGIPEENIRTELTEAALRTGLSMNEATRQIQCGIDNQRRQGVYMPCDANQDYAESYVAQLPDISRVYRAGEWFDYHPGYGWLPVTEDIVEADVTNFIRQTIKQQPFGFGMKKPSIDKRMIEGVMKCIQAMLIVAPSGEERLDFTVWLRFDGNRLVTESAEGWVATRSHLIHVPRVATALYRGERIPEDAIQPVNSSLFTPGMIPCEFDVNALCPRWNQFVAEACSRDAQMLRCMFGLSLTFDRRYNVFCAVHGKAGTGKSTALNVLRSLNTGTTCGVSLSDFGERFLMYPLVQNRLNLVPDMDSVFDGVGSASKREAALKTCTSGEKIQVEKKHKNSEYRYLCALSVFGCNTLPRFGDSSDAISDRTRIISFPVVFRGTETHDKSLGEKLNAELPGVLQWALKGYGELLDSGSPTFPETEHSLALKRETIKASRPVELFCDEFLEKTDLNVLLPTMEVNSRYRAYCEERGYKALGESGVLPRIAEYLGVVKDKKSVYGRQKMCFIGVRFTDSPAVSAEVMERSSS